MRVAIVVCGGGSPPRGQRKNLGWGVGASSGDAVDDGGRGRRLVRCRGMEESRMRVKVLVGGKES